MQAVMSQAQSPQTPGPRMMALDIDSVRVKRPRAGNDESFQYKSIAEICAAFIAWSEPTVRHIQLYCSPHPGGGGQENTNAYS